MLIFTKYRKTCFQGATFSNCFQIFKWIAKESLLHRVPGVHKQAAIGVQINTRKTQEVEITLIQSFFQRHDFETALN